MYNTYLGTLQFPTQASIQLGGWRSLRLHQGWGQHDLAEIVLGYPAAADNPFMTGTPIIGTFGFPPNYRSWNGYIHTPQRAVDGMITEMTLECLGPTYALAGAGQKSWDNVRASDVVQQLCAAHGLAAHVTPTTRVYQHLTQAGMTDWQLINRLGRENGRFVIADGVGVRFLSREDILAPFDASTALTFSYAPDRSTSILAWKPTQSDDPGDSPERAAVKSLSGIDASGGQVIRQVQSATPAAHGSISGLPSFLDIKTNVTVTSAAEAESRQQAATALSSWKYRMQATLRGTPGLEPGIVLRMLGLGRYSGTWVVEQVLHVLEQGTYGCVVELITDALGELPRQYRNTGGIARPFVKATPVLRQSGGGSGASTAFATSQTRWQAQNRVAVASFLPRPAPATSTVRRATRV